MSELKAYAKPPTLVELTLGAVLTVLKVSPSWDEAKKQLNDASFMDKLLHFDKDRLDDPLLKKNRKVHGERRLYAGVCWKGLSYGEGKWEGGHRIMVGRAGG